MNTQVNSPMEAQNPQSELMNWFDQLKGSPIADDRYNGRISDLCRAIGTVSSVVTKDIETFTKRWKIDDNNIRRAWERNLLDITKMVWQIEALAEVIDDMIDKYNDVSDIFYFYKQCCEQMA